MNSSKSRKDTLSSQLVQWLLEQLQSEEDLDTITRQIMALVSSLQGQSRVDFSVHISRLIYEKYLADPEKESTEIYIRLCHSLLLASMKHLPDTPNQIVAVHDHLFGLCMSSLPVASRSEDTLSQSVARLGSGDGFEPILDDPSASFLTNVKATKLPIEAVFQLISNLFKYGLISVAQVYQCVFEVAKPAPFHSVKDTNGLLSLCDLLETHGHGLNTTPWRTEMQRLLKWTEATVLEVDVDGCIQRRIEVIIAELKRSPGSKRFESIRRRDPSLSISSHLGKEEFTGNNYGIHGLETIDGSLCPSPSQPVGKLETEVSALLEVLKVGDFNETSDKIIEWANKSEKEKGGSAFMQVIKLVFEKAKDEVAFSEAYARLCRKMMEQISPNIQDETIRNPQNQLISGGMLLRRCLLDLCQGEFEHVWSAKEASLTPVPLKVGGKDVKIATVENDRLDSSGKYHAADKAKRQSLGLVRFIGELFKLQMLTERVIHYCIQRLLEAEEIESLCELLTTVGQSLDNPKAKNHIDIYFERMQEMVKSSNINSRMQFMLQDVIELRSRRWQAHSAVSLPAPAHQDSSRDGSGRHGVSRGGSRRGGHHGASAAEPELWYVASGAGANRPAAHAGGLSQFDKISKPTGIQFGSSSLFSKKDANKRDSSIGCTGGTNTLSALISGVPGGPSPSTALTTSNRKLSIDLGSGVSPAAAGAGGRKKLKLLPRIKPTESETDKGDDKEKGEATLADLTEEEAQNKVKEDVKEYLGVENIDEAIMALEALPSEHRHLFVDGLVNASMYGSNKVVVLAEKLFSTAQSRSVISPGGFERGLLPTIEMADDLSIDVPKTYEWLARMIHAAGLDKAKAEEMAGKISVYGEPRVPPRELLLKEFEKVSSA